MAIFVPRSLQSARSVLRHRAGLWKFFTGCQCQCTMLQQSSNIDARLYTQQPVFLSFRSPERLLAELAAP
jgi:hypothetical protein